MVEHSVHTRSVICSSQIAATRPVGQAVKTPPFHGGNMGSIPVRVTKKETIHSDGFFFVIRMSERTHRVRPQAFEARERCGCVCSRGFDARVKTNAQWHAAGLAGGVFPYRAAVDPKSHMAPNHPFGWFLFCYPYVRANRLSKNLVEFRRARRNKM